MVGRAGQCSCHIIADCYHVADVKWSAIRLVSVWLLCTDNGRAGELCCCCCCKYEPEVSCVVVQETGVDAVITQCDNDSDQLQQQQYCRCQGYRLGVDDRCWYVVYVVIR